jgi:hypothetical protein
MRDNTRTVPLSPQIQPEGFVGMTEYEADRIGHFKCVRKIFAMRLFLGRFANAEVSSAASPAAICGFPIHSAMMEHLVQVMCDKTALDQS